jgi:ABC-type Fe3+ transport system substrate-binding protein
MHWLSFNRARSAELKGNGTPFEAAAMEPISRLIAIFAALVAVIAAPLLLREPQSLPGAGSDILVIISPHDEAIRYEFSRAFQEAYRRKTGRGVYIDWRLPGGTSEIVRYLNAEFETAFRYKWTREMGLSWTRPVLEGFSNPGLSGRADKSSPGDYARYSFLHSDAGCGIDLFFGGGSFDFINFANRGFLVDSGVLDRNPALFSSGNGIPQTLGGEPYWDPRGRWVGTCLSGFGICYNSDVLGRLGISASPTQWTDLAEKKFFRSLALADPTKSGSVAKAFELIIQQQMNDQLSKLEASGNERTDLIESRAVREGWERGLQLLIRLAANSRYFSGAASKVTSDVAYGEAAAGMCIDFYGRSESEMVADETGRTRLRYNNVTGGTSVGADSIGLLRGAPHPETAKAFLDFVLSIEGQKLWNFKPGTPGGPVRYSLRRLPVRREFYQQPLRSFMTDDEVDPYRDALAFHYHPSWTAPLFSTLRFLVRVMCIDPREELVAARAVIGDAPLNSPAFQKLLDVSRVRYEIALQEIATTLRSADRLKEVRLAELLITHFRNQYREAERMARNPR